MASTLISLDLFISSKIKRKEKPEIKKRRQREQGGRRGGGGGGRGKGGAKGLRLLPGKMMCANAQGDWPMADVEKCDQVARAGGNFTPTRLPFASDQIPFWKYSWG